MRNGVVRLFVAVVSMVLGHAAFAGPASDSARDHFNSIGSGNVGSLKADYTSDAVLNWIGGPLDGRYASPDAIQKLWEKFSVAQGTLKVSVDKLEEASNPKGSTITANVKFEGKTTVTIRYVLVYRDSKIVSETWQVVPNIVSSAY